MKMKKCLRCKESEFNNFKQKYCDECIIIVRKETRDRAEANVRNKKTAKKKLELDEGFSNLPSDPIYLIPKNFFIQTGIKFTSYTSFYLTDWIGVLAIYKRKEDFLNYLKSEFSEWTIKHNRIAIKDFAKDLGFSIDLLKNIDKQLLYPEHYIPHFNANEYSEEELKSNFIKIHKVLKERANGTKFNDLSSIKTYTYYKIYQPEINLYEYLILRYYNDANMVLEHKKNITRQKRESAQEALTGRNTYSDEYLVQNFTCTVDDYLNEYGHTPTVATFQSLTKVGLTAYKKRMKMSYTELLSHFGYEIDKTGSKQEKMALSIISSLLKEDFVPQAKFDWLRSDKNYYLKCDGYYPKHNIVVEYDGIQHFVMIEFFGQESFDRTQANDQIKNTLIPQHGLTLIRISYDEPYYDEDFLRMRLIENGIFPKGYTEVASMPSQKSA